MRVNFFFHSLILLPNSSKNYSKLHSLGLKLLFFRKNRLSFNFLIHFALILSLFYFDVCNLIKYKIGVLELVKNE